MANLIETEHGKSHLGGHLNKTHTDEAIINFIKYEYDIKSMIDIGCCLLYTSPSPRDKRQSRMPSSA